MQIHFELKFACDSERVNTKERLSAMTIENNIDFIFNKRQSNTKWKRVNYLRI